MQMVRVTLPSAALTAVLALAIEQQAEYQMDDRSGSIISFEPDDDTITITMWGPDDADSQSPS